ncbi:MAG: aquaporin [Actinobacteria bacterium]|jgi:glycerol uptake facilitator protein|nr:aquaporin [Actinomycetota bacterium]
MAQTVEAVIETEAPLGRRLLAEFVGAGLLVAIGAGAVTTFLLGPLKEQAARTAEITQGLAPEQIQQLEADTVIQSLLRGGSADLLPIALAFSLILAVIVYAFGGVSGGHFNPAVTFSLAAVRRFPWTEVGPYMVAQIAGGIVGALLIAGVYGQDGAAFADVDILFGATTIAAGVSQWQALLAEALVTFVLVTAIMAVAIDPRGPKAVAGLIIGLSLGAGILVVGPVTGASANFARSLGPIVASLLYETGDPEWGDLWIYAVGPVVGACAAVFMYESVAGLERIPPAAAPEPLGESSVSVSEEGDG